MTNATKGSIEVRGNLQSAYDDVFTPAALRALDALAPFDDDCKQVMAARIERRAARARDKRRIAFLDPGQPHPAHEAHRAGRARRPLRRQRDPSRPAAAVDSGHRTRGASRMRRSRSSIRNVAYALLSGADGWMFDGEDALGQIQTMSLDNQRNLKLAIDTLTGLHEGRRAGRGRDERRGHRGSSAAPIVQDWTRQLDFTTKIFRARGLHLDDRHVRRRDGGGFSASIVDLDALRREQPRAAAERGRVAGAVPAENPDGRGSGAVERHHRGARKPSRYRRRVGQGLRAGRAARGLLPVDGDPRRARPRISSGSTRDGGTTSTASRTRWRGIRTSSIPTSTRSR